MLHGVSRISTLFDAVQYGGTVWIFFPYVYASLNVPDGLFEARIIENIFLNDFSVFFALAAPFIRYDIVNRCILCDIIKES